MEDPTPEPHLNTFGMSWNAGWEPNAISSWPQWGSCVSMGSNAHKIVPTYAIPEERKLLGKNNCPLITLFCQITSKSRCHILMSTFFWSYHKKILWNGFAWCDFVTFKTVTTWFHICTVYVMKWHSYIEEFQ